MHNVTNVYSHLLNAPIISPRNNPTKELMMVSLSFAPLDWFIEYPALALNKDYVRAELKWYLKGDKTDLSIRDHATTWEYCVDSNNEIQSNYGSYFNEQLETVVQILTKDPDSRRAIININQPYHNYVDAPDVPCTIYFNFLIRGGHLHLMAHMRSQDAVFGLRNDLPAFQMFKLIVSDKLCVPPGTLVIHADSFHVYKRHWEVMQKIVDFKHDPIRENGFTHMSALMNWLGE